MQNQNQNNNNPKLNFPILDILSSNSSNQQQDTLFLKNVFFNDKRLFEQQLESSIRYQNIPPIQVNTTTVGENGKPITGKTTITPKNSQKKINDLFVTPELYILNSKIMHTYSKRQNTTFSYLKTYNDFYQLSDFYLAHENPNIRSINLLLRENQERKGGSAKKELFDNFITLKDEVINIQNETSKIIQQFISLLKEVKSKNDRDKLLLQDFNSRAQRFFGRLSKYKPTQQVQSIGNTPGFNDIKEYIKDDYMLLSSFEELLTDFLKLKLIFNIKEEPMTESDINEVILNRLKSTPNNESLKNIYNDLESLNLVIN